ncbi:MAG TPA: bacterial proteasome activator family protein [Acidimicrobiales bacterium]|nr:bacterial proteasome activator family protein [Acidimicrobiales bacterium]
MTDGADLHPSPSPEPVTGDGAPLLGHDPPGEAEAGKGEGVEVATENVEQPAKLLRIGSMIKHLLDEVRHAPLDEASRGRLKSIYDTSVKELSQGLSGDLRSELDRLTLPLEGPTPSDAELRIAQAQLVGWLEGLFHGIQATLFAQQMAARAQLEEMMQQRGLPAPGGPRDHAGGAYL